MTSVIPDTHRLITQLVEEGGFSEHQAEALSNAFQQMDLSALVTKGELQRQLLALKVDMLKWSVPLFLGQAAVFAVIVKWLVG